MAFWGTEVKPGTPFIHAPLNGRLHLSQATLGMGSATQKSIVQCNVGNKRPLFLCCLFPEKAECCQLNLEFEESDEVVFSVIGPRTVHLTGYYLHTSSLNHHNDESESYGEDIAETETERSENSEESEYGGSFINDDDDDDPQVFPSSPESSTGPGSREEMLDLKKSKDGKGRSRRLRKKYQLSESENDDSSQQKDFTIAVSAVEVLDCEIEDTLPISSLCRGNHASNGGKTDVEEKARNETDNLNDNEAEDNATMLDGTNAVVGVQPERECKHNDLSLAATQVGLEDGGKRKRKRRQEHVKEKILKDNVSKDDEGQKSGSNLDSVTQDVHLEDKETQKQNNDKKRKKKKRCKNKEDGDAMKMEPPVLSAHEKKRSVMEVEGKKSNDNATQLSNGIIIEELELGKQNGKIASLGKKACSLDFLLCHFVYVHYIVKLKESGQVFDSSAGTALSKFRLGGEKVPELWNVGLDGMRIGGKRRLTVPPSVSYRNEGASENIPPNSWLVFDVELVKVK
ncbi:hypothetical protein CRYUN_Cryun38cG0009800 [Craigia yunnanensis]